MDRVIIFDRHGKRGVEVQAIVSSVTWGMGEVTDAKILIPLPEDKLTEDLIQFANLVLLQNENLPDWAGVMVPPPTWKAAGIELVVKSPEHYLRNRLTEIEYTPSRTVGSAVLSMIRRTQARDPLPFRISHNHFDAGGAIGGEESIKKGLYIYDVIQTLQDLHPFEWWFDIRTNRGAPLFVPHWSSFRNIKGEPIEVGENGNASWGEPRLVESGDLSSSFTAVQANSISGGKSSTFDLKRRIDKFGLWEEVVSVENLSVGAERPEEVNKRIKDSRLLRCFHIRVPLGSLSMSMRPGSVHLFDAPDVGFTGGQLGTHTTVRVDQMSYSDNEGQLTAVVYEYLENEVET